MKFRSTPESVSLETQAECWVAANVTYQFPVAGRPFGEENLFLNSPPGDLEPAREIGQAAVDLSERIMKARRQMDILGTGGFRLPGTLDKFRPHTIEGEDFAVLRDAVLLVATQRRPERIDSLDTVELAEIGDTQLAWYEINAQRASVEDARLLGALMHDADMLTGGRELLPDLFAFRCDFDVDYRRSIGDAAKRLLEATDREFSYAAGGAEHIAAGQQYRQANPLLVSFAALASE